MCPDDCELRTADCTSQTKVILTDLSLTHIDRALYRKKSQTQGNARGKRSRSVTLMLARQRVADAIARRWQCLVLVGPQAVWGQESCTALTAQHQDRRASTTSASTSECSSSNVLPTYRGQATGRGWPSTGGFSRRALAQQVSEGQPQYYYFYAAKSDDGQSNS